MAQIPNNYALAIGNASTKATLQKLLKSVGETAAAGV